MGKINSRTGAGKSGSKKPFQKKRTSRPAEKNAYKKKEEKPKAKPIPLNMNPFEIKTNKTKFQILGRPTKHERGLPGVARAKAEKKRKNTLLQEYKNKYKSNKLIDKRLGENDPSLPIEAKMEMRFLAEKLKNQTKKSKFILGDDEVLTHKGQTLADIEKFDDPRSDSEDDDDNKLGQDFVSDAHFGGGFLKKSDETAEATQNRESLIDNLIADSKKRKEERQKEREETDELTEKLDLEYKEVMDVLAGIKANSKKSDDPPPKLPDSTYDILVRQLRFDPRVRPGDKLKSADEIAKLEKDKLDKLEADRLKRMKGDFGGTKKIPHRSADDLDDGFYFTPVEPEVKTLSYGMDNGYFEAAASVAPEEDNEDEEDEEDEDEGSGSDAEDGFSDLASSDGEDGTEQEVKTKTKGKTTARPAKGATKLEIPFVFKVPEEYEELHELLQSYGNGDQRIRIVLERMIKSNHPALSGNNKPKMEKLFAFMMQYIHDVASSGSVLLLNELTPVIFELGQLIPPSSVSSTFLDVLLEKREELSSSGRRKPVSVATLVFLKLTALLFPTSDFRHPVTTPAFHLLIEALSIPVNNLQVVHMGLGLCAVAYEFVSLSKRYLPEVVHFLHGLIQLAVPRPSNVAAHGLAFPFRPVGAESQLLVLSTDSTSITPDRIPLVSAELNEQFRVSAIWIAVRLLSDFHSLWSELPAAGEIHAPILESLRKLPIERYNSAVIDSVKSLIVSLEQLSKTLRKRLCREAQKPKPLRLYEPAVDAYFDGRKKRVGSQDKLEQQKLQHKLKREMKGAIREIRKDNSFIARQQLNEQIEKDTDRKRKVKELLSSLAMQEGEVKQLKKPKRK